jgi:multiple sugar transport system substrate-binding protein
MRQGDLKRLCILFFTGFLMTVLTACQGASTTTPSVMPVLNLQTASPTATELPDELRLTSGELEGQEVVVWVPWLDERADQLGYLVEDYNQNNIYGIRVSLTAWGGETVLLDNLSAGIDAQRLLPGIFAVRPEEALRLMGDGLPLTALDAYLASPEWGYSTEERADLIEPSWQLGQNDGIQYGVPAEVNPHYLFYNLTWGLELGFNGPPKTREDFLLQSCKAQQANLADGNKENNGTGGWLVAEDSTDMLAWLVVFGYEVPSDAPYIFDTDEVESSLTYLKNLVVKDCAWLGKADTPYDYFAGRYALLYSGSLTDIAGQRAAFAKSGSTDQWVLIPYPGLVETRVTLEDGTVWFITAGEYPARLAAWVFLRWLSEADQQERMLQVSGAWPTRNSTADIYTAGLESDLVYSYVMTAMKNIQAMPHAAAWSIARRLFEDATWQLFQPETGADQIPALLMNLDGTISEILSIGDD